VPEVDLHFKPEANTKDATVTVTQYESLIPKPPVHFPPLSP